MKRKILLKKMKLNIIWHEILFFMIFKIKLSYILLYDLLWKYLISKQQNYFNKILIEIIKYDNNL